MKKLFIDSDVCLDVLTDRQPFAQKSAQLFTLLHKKQITGLISALCLINVHYFLRKDVGDENARTAILRLKTLLTVHAVTDQIIDQALISNFNDFEDAVQHLTALKAGAEGIITRNLKDFKHSKLPVYTPEDFLKHFI